jgi:hypothetical protein
MPALSFQGEWLLKLLNGTKQQTTRQQTERIKAGDICNIYNQQRKEIIKKPLRNLTDEGYGKMAQLSHKSQGKHYPEVPFTTPDRQYPAHFLGRVKVIEVFDFRPCERNWQELEAWAWADGFQDFASARCWFEIRYGARWMHQAWTVIRWNGWAERYFEPEE